MKKLLLFTVLLISANLFADCHTEIICTPESGCGPQTVCTPPNPDPNPPPGNCKHVWVCDSMGSINCHWETVCE